VKKSKAPEVPDIRRSVAWRKSGRALTGFRYLALAVGAIMTVMLFVALGMARDPYMIGAFVCMLMFTFAVIKVLDHYLANL
jgi:hypothetical protein